MRSLAVFVFFLMVSCLGTIVISHARYYSDEEMCSPSVGTTTIGVSGPDSQGRFWGQYQLFLDCEADYENPCQFCIYGRVTDSGIPPTVVQTNAPTLFQVNAPCGTDDQEQSGTNVYLGTTGGSDPNLFTNGLYTWQILVWFNTTCGPNLFNQAPDSVTYIQFTGNGS